MNDSLVTSKINNGYVLIQKTFKKKLFSNSNNKRNGYLSNGHHENSLNNSSSSNHSINSSGSSYNSDNIFNERANGKGLKSSNDQEWEKTQILPSFNGGDKKKKKNMMDMLINALENNNENDDDELEIDEEDNYQDTPKLQIIPEMKSFYMKKRKLYRILSDDVKMEEPDDPNKDQSANINNINNNNNNNEYEEQGNIKRRKVVFHPDEKRFFFY